MLIYRVFFEDFLPIFLFSFSSLFSLVSAFLSCENRKSYLENGLL